MRKIRGFILCSLFFALKGEFLFAESCSIARGSYACFKYGNHSLREKTPDENWTSFKKESDNTFTSLKDFEGQFLPKSFQDFLGIVNLESILFLKNISGTKAVVINAERERGEDVFSLLSKNSTLIGNIEINKRREGKDFRNKLVFLEFDGGKRIKNSLLEQYEKHILCAHKRKPSQIIETKYNNDQIWAFIGDITNTSKEKIIVDFKNGAKMIGDFYAYDSEIGITFHHYPELIFSMISLPVVFEGGIYNRGGEIDLNIESGGIRAYAVNDADFGILAENGGINTVQFTDIGTIQKPQYLYTSQILAQTNVSNISKTQNTITFINGKDDDQNFMNLYDIIADSGKNIIQTRDNPKIGGTELSLFVDRSILSTSNPKAEHYLSQEIGNVIHIDGMLKIGEYMMKTIDGNDEIFGIMALAGENIIRLKDTLKDVDSQSNIVEVDDDEQSGYYESRSLLTPRIYAGAQNQTIGKNHIEIDGDLKLMYLQSDSNNRGVIGAEIIASDGGENTITLNGAIDVISYRKILENSLNVFINEEVKRDEKDLFKTLIAVYGIHAPSKNTLMIRNTDLGGVFNGAGFRDLILGDVVAYGGSNEIVLYAPFCEDWKGVEIKSLIAGNKDGKGRKHIGGSNLVTITNGVEIIVKKILTQEGGKNYLWIMQDKEMSDIIQISDLAITYGEGGETMLYFGIDDDQNNIKSAMQITLDPWGGKKHLNLNVGKGRDGDFETYGVSVRGSFFGEIQYFKDSQETRNLGEIYYALEDGANFVGMITNKSRMEQSISIGNGAKFIPTNEGSIAFETLAIDSSSKKEKFPLRKTIFMNTSVIDLATSGGGFTNISSKYNARVLDIKSFVIHKDGGYNPLLRYFISSPTLADKIKIGDITTVEDIGLDAQILLPTELIGYDFSDDNVVIFSTQSGGESLELTSTIGQTGFITYTTELIKESHPYPNDPLRSSHTWRLGKSKDVIIDTDFIRFAETLLAHNYGLFQIHFNSLSKRMGELRGDKNANGVWGRAFGGELINFFGYERIDSGYFVAQGGYDRSFDMTKAEDYVGVAFSYGIMDSASRPFVGSYLFDTPFAYEAFSHSVELGAYNVYLHKSGFYSDSIVKIGYLTSKFCGVNDNSVDAEISNFSLTLGQEIGYQVRLGKSDEWFITPSFEMILGYLSPSNAKQKYDSQTLHSTLKGVVTLRNRLGSEVGYTLAGSRASFDFKIGANYVFDYADTSASYSVLEANYIKSITTPSFISPSQQMTINAGINVKLDNNIKLYFEVESSFFGKIRTKYQLNAGIRYSFGERMHRLTPEERAKQNFIKLIAE